MKNLTKRQMKHLRELAGKAYELELSAEMDILHGQFKKWKSKKITVWELSDLIHEFHDGASREMYKFYVYGEDYTLQVAHAIHKGFLTLEDVEESCRENVQYILEKMFKENIEIK